MKQIFRAMNNEILQETLKTFCKIFPRMDEGRNFDYGTIEMKNNNETNLEFSLDNFLSISNNAMISGAMMQDIYSGNKSKESRKGWNEDLEGTRGLKPQWKPIGNRNGDLVFSKNELEDCPVFGIITGSFEPFMIADSIAVYFECLTEIMKIEQEKFHFVTDDEDCVPLKNFISEVERITKTKLSEEAQNGFMEFFFG